MAFEIIETHELMKVVSTLHRPSSYWLDLCFPQVHLSNSEYIDFDIVDKARRLAPFVAPTVQGQPMVQRGESIRKFKPAYIKPKDPVDPARLLRRTAGEMFGGSLSPSQREDLIVNDILQEHSDGIWRRWEWMAAGAIIDSAITVTGENYPTVNLAFGRDATHTVTLSGATLWTDPASKPLEDIENWMQKVFRKSGYVVTRITMGLDAWNAFYKHSTVEKMLDTRRGSDNKIETGPGDGTPAQFRGRLTSNGVEIWTYNDIYEDNTGTAQPFMAQDSIVLTSSAVDGVRAFGAIMDRKAGWNAQPMFPKMWEQEDPSGLFLMTQSAPLMIPTRPNATLKAKVV